MTAERNDQTGRACKCPACFVERYSVGATKFAASAKERWQFWPAQEPFTGESAIARWDLGKLEKLWVELTGDIK